MFETSQLKNVAEQISAIEQTRVITPEILAKYLPEQHAGTPVAAGAPATDDGMSTERELLYKVLFDMRADINDLKRMLSELMRTVDTHRADAAPDIRALLPTRTQSAGAYAPVPHGIYPPSASAPCSAPTAPAGGESAPVYVESEEVTDTPPREKTKADMQREQIIRALRRNNGRRREAAAELFMSERTLYRKIKELGIEDY